MVLLSAGCTPTQNNGAETPNMNQNENYDPIEFVHTHPPTTVSSATWHTLAVLENGELWAWGQNFQGQIGDGSTEKRLAPVKVMDNVFSAVAGHYHSLAITKNGELWAWGENFVGQIGDGSTQRRLTPVKIMDNVVYAAISPVLPNTHVSYGARSFAITADGTLWAWGQNGFWDGGWPRIIGDGTTEERHSPVRIMDNVASVTPTFSGAYARTKDGALWEWGEDQLYPAMVREPYTAEAYMEEPVFDFEIDEYGALWTRGRNQPPCHWQWEPLVGDGTTEPRPSPIRIMDNVRSVTIAADTIFAIAGDGALWTWGYNNIGQLGDGTTETRLSPIRIMDDVVSVSASYWIDHGWVSFINIFALTKDGTLWAWGGNSFGAGLLGDGTDEQRLSPVPILDGVKIPCFS